MQNYVDWGMRYVEEGREVWMITFQFRQIGGAPGHVHNVMREEIERVYRTHVTRVNKYAGRAVGRTQLPIWVMVPDWPVPKAEKHLKHDVTINNGLHYAGFAAMPHVHYLKQPLNEHFDENKPGYVREPFPLLRVRVDPIVETPRKALAYSFKSLGRARATSDDVFILPFALSELTTRKELLTTGKDR